MSEQGQGIPVSKAEQDAKNVDDLVDAARPKAAQPTFRIAGPKDSPFESYDKTFTQRPLSFFPKIEFTRLLSRTLKNAIANTELNLEQIRGQIRTATNVEGFVSILLELSQAAPEFLKDITMIALNVPRHERDIVSEILSMPTEDDGTGGISDEQGVLILTTFAAQNTKAIADFFRVHIPSLAKEVSALINDGQTQDSSKPSRDSAQPTGLPR